MRKGLLTLLGFLVAGAGVSLAQSYPGNPAFPTLDPAGGRAVPPPVAPVAEADFPEDAGVLAEVDRPADRFWFSADYLLWWTKNGPLPTPLVTAGSIEQTVIGGLTQPGTQLLFGGSDQNYGTASGLRLGTGLWLDDDRRWGLEGGYFLLERRSTGFRVASDAFGNPALAEPLLAPGDGEFTELVSLPGLIAGGVTVTTHSRLQGWEMNGAVNALRGDGLSVDLLGGFRAVDLTEDLQVFTGFSPLVDDFLTFQNQFVNVPSTLTTLDAFQTQNHFYGPQLGGRVEWDLGRFTVGALGKVAVGDNQELVHIVGTSALSTPSGATIPVAASPALRLPLGVPVTVPGGVLAQVSNAGDHFRDQFAVVPEIGLQVSYQVTRNLEVHVGYSFLYWSNVVRPGDVVDRTVTAGLVPTDPLFGTATGTRPAFQFHSSDYWAQGVNFGLGLRF